MNRIEISTSLHIHSAITAGYELNGALDPQRTITRHWLTGLASLRSLPYAFVLARLSRSEIVSLQRSDIANSINFEL